MFLLLAVAAACGGGDFGGPGALAPGPNAPSATTPTPVQQDAPDRAGTDDADATPVLLTSAADSRNAVVSLGVPFPPGVVVDPSTVAVIDGHGKDVPREASLLARWPTDGSIRSLGVAFRVTLAADESSVFRIRYRNAKGTPSPEPLKMEPDGPIVATLTAQWYGASLVSGRQVPAAADTRFPAYETALEHGLVAMKPAYESFHSNCPHTAQHRTYYDGPHAFFQRFERAPGRSTYRRARDEATLYRASELRWVDGRTMAVQVCQAPGWTPDKPLSWDVLRRMTGQGMLDDYLLTGDPLAREAVLAMGEAMRRNLPALMNGRENILVITERNMAWTLMGIASEYALDPRPEIKRALDTIVTLAVAWQNRGTSGAFEHDIVRPDPEECSKGPHGASPFMTSLLVDALMDYHALTLDPRIADVVRRVAIWYEKDAITSDGKAFRYLWNCIDDANDDSGVADLNLLIVHVFGAAYALTKDRHWIVFGDAIADAGIAAMQTSTPKQWNQAARSFGRYLGYRSMGAPP